ncbi:MAG: hypothetical protein LBD47_13345 [Treponema sp.]|nr:hypothetical protein [Treponema sp.]
MTLQILFLIVFLNTTSRYSGLFSKSVFIAAPNLTVRSRLQVLRTGGDDNYYVEFNVVPSALFDKLRQGKVVISNWQALAWDTAEDLAKKNL